MQSRIRKTRCTKRVEWIRKYALTCFSIALISCAHNRPKPEDLGRVKSQLTKLCLNGEGRGRIKVLSNTILFSYESMNSIEDKLWKMGVDIPLHGPELLSLFWGEIKSSGAKLKGQFARRIYSSLRNHKDSKENLSNLRSFADGLGQIIYLSHQLKFIKTELCDNYSCRVGKGELKWKFISGDLVFDYISQKGALMRFTFSHLTDQGPRRISISPINKGKESDSFKIELFLNSCE